MYIHILEKNNFLCHTAKTLKARQFAQKYLCEKAPGSKKIFVILFTKFTKFNNKIDITALLQFYYLFQPELNN